MKSRIPTTPCRCAPRAGTRRLIRFGRFYRTSDSRWIQRWRCLDCRKTFSNATSDPCYRQHKRRTNLPLYRLFCSGVSQRRAAKLMHLTRRTAVRKFRFLAEQCRLTHADYLVRFEGKKLTALIFDEMETFEHTKFKPLSIALAVTPERQILSIEVASMPSKGLLAAKSRKKYGIRKDERPGALRRMFKVLQPLVVDDAIFKSDQNPSYPLALSRAFPKAIHVTTKGGRAAVVGQGELKKLNWDPIFALNHTAAMFRANMNRLFRRTWCTTKTARGLRDHLALYVTYHNLELLPQG